MRLFSLPLLAFIAVVSGCASMETMDRWRKVEAEADERDRQFAVIEKARAVVAGDKFDRAAFSSILTEKNLMSARVRSGIIEVVSEYSDGKVAVHVEAAKMISNLIDPFEKFRDSYSSAGYACTNRDLASAFFDGRAFDRHNKERVIYAFQSCIVNGATGANDNETAFILNKYKNLYALDSGVAAAVRDIVYNCINGCYESIRIVTESRSSQWLLAAKRISLFYFDKYFDGSAASEDEFGVVLSAHPLLRKNSTLSVAENERLTEHYYEIVMRMLKAGGHLPKKNEGAGLALMDAIVAGKADYFSALLRGGVDVNFVVLGQSPLDTAIKHNREAYALDLIAAGADLGAGGEAHAIFKADDAKMDRVVNRIQGMAVALPDIYEIADRYVRNGDVDKARYWQRKAGKFTPNINKQNRLEASVSVLEARLAQERLDRAAQRASQYAGMASSTVSCAVDDTPCFDVVRSDKKGSDPRVVILCKGGSNSGMEKEICSWSYAKGKWGGCGYADFNHTRTFTAAGNYQCY